MLVAIIIITGILSFFGIWVARKADDKRDSPGYIWDFFMAISGIFCFSLFLATTIVSFIVNFGSSAPLEKDEVTEFNYVTTTSHKLICVKDDFSITGSLSGKESRNIFLVYESVSGSVSEESVYKYYYLLKDSGIKLGTIPADSTTIYYIESEEEPHIETVITTKFQMINKGKPDAHCDETSKTIYKLYVPEGPISNVYEFDAE